MTSLRYLGVCIAPIFIAGCQGAGTAPQTNARPDARAFRGAGSWISPAAKQQPLIYTPDGSDVFIYTYSGQQVGLLQGFSEPHGVCSDSQGNVYVTDAGSVDAGAAVVYEYARGGTLPINVIDDSGQYPNSCAVDPTTGSLAVANDSSHANVLIFPPGSFTVPTAYTATNMVDYEFCGYDSAGNLYVDGYGAKASFQTSRASERRRYASRPADRRTQQQGPRCRRSAMGWSIRGGRRLAEAGHVSHRRFGESGFHCRQATPEGHR